MAPVKSAGRVVIKLGSALIADADTGKADMAFLSRLAKATNKLAEQGTQTLIVSSGAIALGRGQLGIGRPTKLEQKQAAAAIGQVHLMAAFGAAFAPVGMGLAQNLITLEDTENRRRWLNARNTLETLLDRNIVPIINENDTIATDEIRFGDNDRLAARVATMMGANTLYLLSDVDGLYSANPKTTPDAHHIPILDALDRGVFAFADSDTSDISSGGMQTKLLAADIAFKAGCATVICNGAKAFPFIDSKVKHTRIQPKVNVQTARRVWLEGHLVPNGKLVIDQGAEDALNKGASLLPVGVIGFEGEFQRGDAVGVYDPNAVLIAKGIVNYAAEHVRQIAGRRSTDLLADHTADFTRNTLIHRDDLVMIGTQK